MCGNDTHALHTSQMREKMNLALPFMERNLRTELISYIIYKYLILFPFQASLESSIYIVRVHVI